VARIALVHDVAGVAKVQAETLRAAGHEVDLIPLSELGASWKWPLKALAIPLRLAAYLPVIRKLRSSHYDIVHIHWLSHGIVGLTLGRPFFAQAHGSDLHVNMRKPVLRMVTRAVLKRAKDVFYVTPDLRAFALDFDYKLRYLPNPVQVSEATSPPPRRLARALIFTMLHSRKGVEQIFPAAHRLSTLVELTTLDYGPLARDYAQRYGGVVRFVPQVPHDEIGPFLEQFDIVIGQMRQGILALSELEAMAAGRPVITGINLANYPEDPPPVIVASNPDEIAHAVEQLKDDEAELERLSLAGRDWVRRNHGFARNLQQLEEAYFGSASPSKSTAQ
jgi:glycosyltransferase involved in cell wall biosynthesis